MAGGDLLALLRVSVLVVVRFAFIEVALEVALVVALVAALVIARIVYIYLIYFLLWSCRCNLSHFCPSGGSLIRGVQYVESYIVEVICTNSLSNPPLL
jgi:hypothetical protein